jgi:large subunit ribosomal protein L6
MSRIGRLPIELPKGVTITVKDDNTVVVKGPKGELTEKFNEQIKIEVDGNTVTVTRPNDDKEMRSLHGLVRTLVFNMVEGVSNMFIKQLEITGVGYRAQLSGKKLVLNLGYSHPVEFEPEKDIEFEVPSPTAITVRGIDKQAVGQIAADIRKMRPPEPYKGKGIKYKGEYVRRKEGKTGM